MGQAWQQDRQHDGEDCRIDPGMNQEKGNGARQHNHAGKIKSRDDGQVGKNVVNEGGRKTGRRRQDHGRHPPAAEQGPANPFGSQAADHAGHAQTACLGQQQQRVRETVG